VGTHPAELELYSPSAIARTASGFVIAGEPLEGGPGEGNYLTIWESTVEGDWERKHEQSSRSPQSIVVVGDTVVVAGGELDLRDPTIDSPPRLPWLLVSEDGGASWDDSLGWAGTEEWCLRSLTRGRSTVLLDAACATPDAASKYVVGIEATPSDG